MNWNVALDKKVFVVTAVKVLKFNETVFLTPFMTAHIMFC